MSTHLRFIILYIVGGLLLFELLLFNIIVPLYKYLRRKGSPVRTVRARVLLSENRMAALLPWWMRIPIGGRNGGVSDGQLEDWGKQYTYWITFEIGSSRQEFQVGEDEFSEFEPDDVGELSYQADKVLSFKRESPEDSAIDC